MLTRRIQLQASPVARRELSSPYKANNTNAAVCQSDPLVVLGDEACCRRPRWRSGCDGSLELRRRPQDRHAVFGEAREKVTVERGDSTFVAMLRHVQRGLARRQISLVARWMTSAAREADEIRRIRNIGVIAHIDAGKTTTSERFLFYSGRIRAIGNVDDGTTELDYLDEERERGITIVSAATTFNWRNCRVNLIDTPGHMDFTVEVERSLRVLDGAIAVIDGVAGVQAQTETVWRQANKYNIPRVAFVNKMDRDGASLDHVLTTITARLSAVPLVLQLPIGEGRAFSGVVDVVRMEKIAFNGPDGEVVEHTPITAASHHALHTSMMQARTALVDALLDLDDELLQHVLGSDVTETGALPADMLVPAIRRATLACSGIPVLCGASRRNKGVQPVMDAIVDYLPSPLDRPPIELEHAVSAGKHGRAESKVWSWYHADLLIFLIFAPF